MLNRFVIYGSFALIVAGCSSDGDGDNHNNGDVGGKLIITGALAEQRAGTTTELLAGVVEARVDADGDGLFNDGVGTTVTVTDGSYRIEVELRERRRVSLTLRSSNGGTGVAEVVGGPGQRAVRDLTAPLLTPLSCQASRCAGAGIQIEGLAPGTTAKGISLSPIADRNLFPGNWGTDNGELLESGGFVFASLTGPDGERTGELASPAELTFELPRASWNEVRDITSGNAVIDVPLYSFDEELGTWRRDGEAILVDVVGEPIPATEVGAIRDGSYAGVVMAQGDVSHFSYWNVDWPLESVTALKIELDLAGMPGDDEVPTFNIEGLTYSGGGQIVPNSSRSQVFCVATRRSEPEGVDDDFNGETGEAHRTRLTVSRGGATYAIDFDNPVETASCDDPIDLGVLAATEGVELDVKICEFEGTVVDLEGNPLPGAIVRASDPGVPLTIGRDLCGANGCDETAFVEFDGNFTFRAAFESTIDLAGIAVVTDGNRSGRMMIDECPSQPVTFVMDRGYDYESLTISRAGDSISWEPAVPVGSISVGRDGSMLWQLLWGAQRFEPPVNYGDVPSGAYQSFPEEGAPDALMTGDFMRILGIGEGDLYPVQYEGTFTVE